MLDRRLTADRNEVESVASHVVRIPLPLPLSDLRAVNVYAVLGDEGVTLVDSGWADEPSESVIIEALRGIGFAPGDVRRILVTHAHWDHFSRAILWQRRYGTTVLLGRQEHHTVEAFDEIDGAYPMQARLLRRAGAPADDRRLGARTVRTGRAVRAARHLARRRR
jgi:glyoxylase-like metal-dependent hydrolase (beta-lactamase superfamily II)